MHFVSTQSWWWWWWWWGQGQKTGELEVMIWVVTWGTTTLCEELLHIHLLLTVVPYERVCVYVCAHACAHEFAHTSFVLV